MTRITRRRFLTASALTLAATRLPAGSPDALPVTLSIPAEANGPYIPAHFMGLSYEVEEFTDLDFFSAKNESLIRAFNSLAPQGVLRVGGNTSDFGWWKPTPDSPPPQHPFLRETVGFPKPRYYPVTPQAVLNLNSFLEATGWSCIYGINMGTNTPQRAAQEAQFVAKALGPRLQYFQIGNEPDLFGQHLRDPKNWSAKTYLAEWLTLARAIAARVPEAKFGMPDIAGHMPWLTEIAGLWGAIKNPPQIVALTHHYYFGGPPSNPEVNIPNLLKPATMAKVQEMADVASSAAAKMHIRVRMSEGNTCYRGGKPGVSDVFASALWSADYALLLASNNYSGINLHGGTSAMIASGLGGVMFGDAVLKAQGATPKQIAAHPHPYYAPIALFGSDYVLEPVAYGLIFAGALREGTLIPAGLTAKLQQAGVNATAYAAKLADGQIAVVLLNKDADKDLAVQLDFGPGKTRVVETETLRAPALDSRAAHIQHSALSSLLKDGKFTAHVPRASGLRIIVA